MAQLSDSFKSLRTILEETASTLEYDAWLYGDQRSFGHRTKVADARRVRLALSLINCEEREAL